MSLYRNKFRLHNIGGRSNAVKNTISFITILKSLVSSKLIYSMELGIHTDIEVKEPVEAFFIDSLDMARVLGIFLDNAIDAALETEEKVLRFCMFYAAAARYFERNNNSFKPLFLLLQSVHNY